MQAIHNNLMQYIIKQDVTTLLKDGKYYSNNGSSFTGLNIKDGNISHVTLGTFEEIEQWLGEKDLKLEEVMKKHAKDLTEEEHDMVFRSFKIVEDEELKENIKASNHSVRLTNEEFEELADLAMRSPGMNPLLRSKLFIGVQAIKEDPFERMLKRMMSQGML